MELIDSNFYPNRGLGNISFNFQEDDILKIMGYPEERVIYNYSENDSAICLFYNKKGVIFWIHYDGLFFDYLSINVDDIILDGIKFSILTKLDILKYIKKYHIKHEYDYLCEKEFNEEFNEELYHFENIGLSIWFKKEHISDISIKKASNHIASYVN